MSNIIIIINFSLFLPYFIFVVSIAGKRVINFVIKKEGRAQEEGNDEKIEK